jgi:hypothetical protein
MIFVPGCIAEIAEAFKQQIIRIILRDIFNLDKF